VETVVHFNCGSTVDIHSSAHSPTVSFRPALDVQVPRRTSDSARASHRSASARLPNVEGAVCLPPSGPM
jgi:hypothetical protein